MTCITFIVPIRHQDNSENWSTLVRNLEQTILSISAQKNTDWKAVIVANHGANLPKLPEKFELCRVGLPPNEIYSRGAADLEDFREAVRLDKGRRIFAGIQFAGKTKYLMFVDDDDLVHCDLTQFICDNPNENGWYIENGLIWNDNSKLLMEYPEFYRFCGTSHIVRSDLLHLAIFENDLEFKNIKRLLGSHIYLKNELEKNNTPLKPLPFKGAIYRIGHADAHSKSKGIFRTFFFNKAVLKFPRKMVARLFRLRWRTQRIQRLYFGASDRN